MARLVVLGTPAPAATALRALVAAGHRVELVVTRPDRRRGRGSLLMASPVKEAALQLGLPVTSRLDDVAQVGAELGVVVAYGKIIPQRLLDVVPMVNLHFSLLPRWRGAAPVERALLAGDERTGVCVMRLDAGLDTGPVIARREIAISDGDDAASLTRRLSEVGAELLVEVLAPGVAAIPPGDPQVGEPTYAAKIEPQELRISWEQPALAISRLVRLGRAFTTWRGQRLRVLEASPLEGGAVEPPATVVVRGGQLAVVTGGGLLQVQRVQPGGKRPMPADEWLRGARPLPGERFGEAAAAGAGVSTTASAAPGSPPGDR